MAKPRKMRLSPALPAAVLLPAALLAAGCGHDAGVGPLVTTDVALGSGEYAVYGGSAAEGTLRFPAAGTAGAQWLLVSQFAGGDTVTAPVLFTGTAQNPAAAIGPRLAAAEPVPGEGGAALRFHEAIRRLDEAAARASIGMPRAPLRAAGAPAGPPAVGTLRSFKVCGNVTCDRSSLVTVGARVQVVGAHNALYVDTLAPAGGFTATDLQQLDAQFDTVLYPIDRTAFGAESDIDGNGVVLILLTPRVNALVPRPACSTSYVTGFFLGADIAPAYAAQYNDGEIFYGMVPDPSGLVACPHTTAQVKAVLGPTFIHEFQHMISFNQHVLVRGGDAEELWLNEAMSHLAEELGGRHYDSLGTASGDSVAGRFLLGDLFNANLYLEHPAGTAVVALAGLDSLKQRGAQWLFVRYLVDQLGATTTQRLVQTSLLGATNVAAVAGTPFGTLVGRWALALYVSDLPSFTPDPALTYRSWSFRATFDSLYRSDPASFPHGFALVPPTVAGGAFVSADTLSTGSARYVIVTQAAGAPAFSVTLRSGSGGALPSRAMPQLAVVRLQ